MTITPFRPDVPDAVLDDLRTRLGHVRWPEAETVDDAGQGPQLGAMQALVEHWRTRYDWRRAEEVLDGFGQFRTEVGGLGVHFLHTRSPEPDALPLLLCHGWPGSVLEFRDVIGPLTDPVAHGGSAEDAFHVVVPSMPGFGFSDRPTTTGWGVGRIAGAWAELMDRLGYGDRFGAQGGDWGAAVVDRMGRDAPPGLVGMHLNLVPAFPTADEVASATPEEQEMIASAGRYTAELSAYAAVQSTRPQTVGYLLADNPVGLAAWIHALFADVSDTDGDPAAVLGSDAILDDVMLYWLPNAGASSARLYWEAAREAPAAGGPNPTPLGVSVFPKEPVRASQRWIEARYATVVHHRRHDRGGHFAAMEQPAALVEDVRATFRGLR
ncbi:epoxide hydrolase family protein [Actinomycetospora sp. NBRC 106378]|uniref:epoxide hydrolase family protein n=1 Tax=Actinomycetospora sp. NBRC 106378 TaxID=3032208 RepID=UPI0024A2594D|nr:epoxide hydrolase family protein [Actinomycetospora sp. NBRC 106378]GLZ51649.1 multidrug MFS transporter [Actinomycetospora sp. NBRC 106378]